MKWAAVVPTLIGHPLYHWTHMELKRFFHIDTLLNEQTASMIYEEANKQLAHLTPRHMIQIYDVETIVTTDDPLDDLVWHDKIKNDDSFHVHVLPAFRPDKVINIELKSFNKWVDQLAIVVGYTIDDFAHLKQALESRVEYFHQHGSRLADHGLDHLVYEQATQEDVEKIFIKARKQNVLNAYEIAQYKGFLLTFLGALYHRYGWVQQYHIGAQRNISKRQFEQLGPDTGFDAIGDQHIAKPLASLMSALDEQKHLPKTIIYTLNPSDFEVALSTMQAFQGDGIPGKIQFGSAWWFLDHIDGMTKQMKALGTQGLLSQFIGMLTDSRSFLSYSRHEYFRRILCNVIGEQVERGYYPYDEMMLAKIVKAICYHNAKQYFSF